MADIAMLVAEEYERRVKNSRKNGEDPELFCSFSLFVQRFENYYKDKFGGEKTEINNVIKWGLEPKSQVGLAAVNGFFSA